MMRSICALTMASASLAFGQLEPAAVLEQFATVTQPVMVTAPANETDRVYVVDRTGRIRIIDSSTGAAMGTFLDVRSITSTAGDGGLLCMAFSPNYATDGTFYIYHNSLPDSNGVIARYQVSSNPLVANVFSRQIVLNYPRPIGHNGGWLGFSPADGMLHLAVGDGGNSELPDPLNRSQNLVDSFFGKVLRIDPTGDDFPLDANKNYRIPAGNPFIDLPGDDEVWAYGLRNPWRCSFDRDTGDFWITDVGQDTWEEINFEPFGDTGGNNYGWRCLEGTLCTGLGGCDCGDISLAPPLYKVPHTNGECSISGGYVYRGAAIPALQGLYLYSDFCSSRIFTLDRSQPDLGNTDRTLEFQPLGAPLIQGVASFGEDALGELYVCDFFGSKVYKLLPAPCSPRFTLQPSGLTAQVGASLTLEAGVYGRGPMTLQWTRNSVPLTDDTRISGSNTSEITIQNVRIEDAGTYALRVTTACGQGQSSLAVVTIPQQCPADWDQSGGVDGDDIIGFFGAWDTNQPTADFNNDGGVDGDDVIGFFARWDQNC